MCYHPTAIRLSRAKKFSKTTTHWQRLWTATLQHQFQGYHLVTATLENETTSFCKAEYTHPLVTGHPTSGHTLNAPAPGHHGTQTRTFMDCMVRISDVLETTQMSIHSSLDLPSLLHTLEFYTAVKRNEMLQQAWMNRQHDSWESMPPRLQRGGVHLYEVQKQGKLTLCCLELWVW